MSRRNRALVIAVVACLSAPGTGLAQIIDFDLDDAYVDAVSEAADALVAERLLLASDADAIVGLARGSRSTTQD